MKNEKWDIIAERCIDWMNDVIECHIDDETGEPQFDRSEEVMEDARFILDCINFVRAFRG